jgi:hypothetical protein
MLSFVFCWCKQNKTMLVILNEDETFMKLCQSISLLRRQNDPPISNNVSITMHALK